MRRIAHLSDLHFGREDHQVVEGLLADLKVAKPDLVVVSGDLTQRARRAQFRKAGRFLERLPAPVVSVPGNHDLPLFDVARRMLSPRARYRRHIAPHAPSRYHDDEIAVLGLDTTRASNWKDGAVSRRQLETVRTWAGKAGPRLRILVAHHPFMPPESHPHVTVVPRADEAVRAMEAAGIDLVLAGHLHRDSHRDARLFAVGLEKSLMLVQAGTATSVRTRGTPQTYNLLDAAGDRLGIEVRAWTGTGFAPLSVQVYARHGHHWLPQERTVSAIGVARAADVAATHRPAPT